MNFYLLTNSLLVATLSTVLAVTMGFISALWLASLSGRWRTGFAAAAIIALALPPFVVTNCWLHLLGHTGVWRRFLPFDIFSLGGAVWILGLLLWPITLFAVSSSWQRLEPAQLESDMLVSGWPLIRALLFPLARGALVQAAVLTFVLALNNFSVPAILQVKVFPAESWILFNTTFDSWGALRMAWPLIAGPFLLLLWLSRRQIPWPHWSMPVPAPLFRRQLGPLWFWACGACSVLLVLVASCLPLVQILSVSRTWTELPGALAAGQSAVWNSFWFAAVSATAVSILGVVFNSFLQHSFERSRALVSNVLWFPFLTPGVILGIGLIWVFNRPWSSVFYQSAGIVLVAFAIRYSALGWNGARHALQSVDSDLIDVARLNGTTRWQMLRHVHWPEIAPQIVAGWYIVFLLCLWDVESIILVVPPGGETLALRIFNLLHYGYNAQVNALCLTLLVLALVPLVLYQGWRLWIHSLKGGAPPPPATAMGLLLMFALCAVLASCLSCTPQSGANEAPLNSAIFSRVEIIGSRGTGVGQLNKPRSVAVDAQDNLYVVDMTGRVQKFSPQGKFLLSWQMPQTDLGKPKGMGRDCDGNIIVVEPHYQRVNHFSTDGKLLLQWGRKGTNSGQFSMPRSVAMNSRREIFISEYGMAERIQKFVFGAGDIERGKAPAFVASYGKPGTGPGEFNRAEGICIARDRLYVADSCNHRIQIFSTDGKFIRAFGRAGRGKGEFSYPYDICVDSDGRQFVCEFGNSRLQVFDANDQPIEIIGGPGVLPGQFSNPWSLALDSAGNLYVADSQNHRVQKFIRK
ncbi:MAG TPA: 6-bladed beta-propeller [Verrucomicrobiae bacterium]|nr:6-bladed beta-propeller [Verrucomicrobiae bacterium]